MTPREVGDVLPDCSAHPPDSDAAAAASVFTLALRQHLDGTADAARVLEAVGSVLAWCGYPESVIGMPLGSLLRVADEWDETCGRTVRSSPR